MHCFIKHYKPRSVSDYELSTFVVSCSVLIECAFMTGGTWRSLYVSFAYKRASLICTSLSRPNAVHISGVHCNYIRTTKQPWA